jgi:putative hydrolase of the HAD superfamily
LRAVIFDIYGTLFVSGSGDIGVDAAGNRAGAMSAALESGGLRLTDAAAEVPALFTDAIRRAQALRRAQGVQFPEVEIRHVWAEFLRTLLDRELAAGAMPDADGVERICVEYECLVNPVWPMPGLAECLSRMHDSHLLMGIVSNAQFFTPPLFEAFLGRGVEGLGFEPFCTLYSYKLLEAKPSTRLFELLVAGLREHGFAPEQALYIGNDMRNDIAPAREMGLKTCLFAGDARSLRMRAGDPLVEGVTPDRVMTDLAQLREITG